MKCSDLILGMNNAKSQFQDHCEFNALEGQNKCLSLHELTLRKNPSHAVEMCAIRRLQKVAAQFYCCFSGHIIFLLITTAKKALECWDMVSLGQLN